MLPWRPLPSKPPGKKGEATVTFRPLQPERPNGAGPLGAIPSLASQEEVRMQSYPGLPKVPATRAHIQHFSLLGTSACNEETEAEIGDEIFPHAMQLISSGAGTKPCPGHCMSSSFPFITRSCAAEFCLSLPSP